VGEGRLSGLPRDRDAAGRPRSARLRDPTGRPLPRATAASPTSPDESIPTAAPAPPDLPALPPGEALRAASTLLAAGSPFAAHEVLEAVWKTAPAGERDFWQGLAQLAVGLTHAQRGNLVGARALLRRGTQRLAPYEAAPPHGVDVAGLRRAALDRAADPTTTEPFPALHR